MSRAPHRVNSVYINANGEFVPKGVELKRLRAEEYRVTERGKIYLTLSDYYADEYVVNMGDDNCTMRAFVDRLTCDKRFCIVKSHEFESDGKTFFKPVVKALGKQVDRFDHIN